MNELEEEVSRWKTRYDNCQIARINAEKECNQLKMYLEKTRWLISEMLEHDGAEGFSQYIYDELEANDWILLP